MDDLRPYTQLLRSFQPKISFRVEAHGNHLVIGQIPFCLSASFPRQDSLTHRPTGVLLPSCTKEQRRRYEHAGISYLCLDGHVHLTLPNQTVHIEPKENEPKRRFTSLRFSSNEPRPTTFISPKGLIIVDILFRLSKAEIERYSSVLEFAKAFSLPQPKISRMMTAIKADSLVMLREKIALLSMDWWRSAMDYSLTKKRLTPFFQRAAVFHSLDPRLASTNAIERTVKVSARLWIPGPPSIAQATGVLKDSSVYFWCPITEVPNFKRIYQLVPGTDPHGVNWYLAIPSRSFEEEAILSIIPDAPILGVDARWRMANVFRALWDLSFGDTRLREVRMILLERVLHGIR